MHLSPQPGTRARRTRQWPLRSPGSPTQHRRRTARQPVSGPHTPPCDTRALSSNGNCRPGHPGNTHSPAAAPAAARPTCTMRLLRDLAQDRCLARLGPGARRGALSLRLPAGVIGVALSWHAFSPGTARGEARKGFAQLEVAVPSSPDITRRGEEEPVSVIIGMDPHKRSATTGIVDERAAVLATGRFATDRAGYAQMLAAGRKFADRTWAVEGCNGIGRHLAHRLVHDGETVVDVPPKLSAQVRVSPPAMAARPTRSTRTRSRWSRCAARAWSGSRSMMTWW